MAPEEPHQRPARWLSDAALIAGIPAALYLLTLAFQFGFATTFGVPFQFITVSWTDAFVIGTILLFLALTLFQLSLLISSSSKNEASPAYFRAINPMLGLLLLADFVYLIAVDWHRWFIITALICLVIGVVSGRIIDREKTIHEKVDPEGSRHFQIGVLLFFWGLASIATSMIGGEVNAKYQKEFFVSQGSPETVVLGIWGDTVVTAPFDRQTRTVKREYIVTKLTDHSALDIRSENVGPLHLETSP